MTRRASFRLAAPFIVAAPLLGVPGTASAAFVPAPPGTWIPLDPPGLFHRCWILLLGWLLSDGPPTQDSPRLRAPIYGGGVCQTCPPEVFPDGCP